MTPLLKTTLARHLCRHVFSARTALPLPVRNERGEGRGEGHPTADTPAHLQPRGPSSPRPSPPSAGGEGIETGAPNTYLCRAQLDTARVAAGILPAVEPGRPARRTRRTKDLRPGKSPALPEVRQHVPGGGTHALYVRRDARRYGSVAVACLALAFAVMTRFT
ncbi:MAG TPA: hypothetical protein VGK40_04295, partial [Verrucomicrobiae bacterium]